MADEVHISPLLGGPCDEDATNGRWIFPKSDLFHWVGLLDRFDDLLAKIIEDLWDKQTQLQSKSFSEEGRLLVCRMLVFTRLLLENCSNDLVVLEKTLELLLIPARKLDSQSSLRNTFDREIGTDELVTLAQLALPFLPDMGELEEAKFALLFREHHSKRVSLLMQEDAERVQYIKMLSTAIFLMAQPDGSIDSAFFALSPTLVADTAKLVSSVPNKLMKTELAALSILRSCLKSPSKWTEIMHSLKISAGHGPIVSTFRSLVDSMIQEVPIPYPPMFFFAYMDFVGVLTTQVDLDDAFINSGIVSEAVRAIDNMKPEYYKILEKTLYILDALVHHYASALDSFFMNNGLVAIVKQLTLLIEASKRSFQENTPFSHSESILLQCLLRFLDKLLTSNGSDDRLRNLLEGPFFKSMNHIFAFDDRFSVEIFTYSVSIVTSFIHNEPTSLSILQEVGTPQALLQSLKKNIPVSAELLSKIPYAFSAICLNSTGAEFFANINAVSTLCSIFLNVDMLRILRSRSTASSLGTAMDEFIRHHPQFRSLVIKSLVETIQKIPSLITSLASSTELFIGCRLVGSEDVNTTEKRSEPLLSQILETISSFVEGCIQTPSHAQEFISEGGVNAIMEVFYTPGISYDFTVYNESLSISHMLRVLSDVDGEHVIVAILRFWVQRAPEMDNYLSNVRPSSFFSPIILLGSSNTEEFNAVFHRLTSSLAIIGLLRDLYVTHSYTFARIGGSLLKAFTSTEGEAAIVFLVLLLKTSSWEFGQIMQSLSESASAALLLKAKADFKAPIFSTFSAAISQLSLGRNLQSLPEGELKEKASQVPPYVVKNILYLTFTLQRLMTNIAAVLSGLAKMVSSRNLTADAQQNEKLRDTIANCGLNGINWLLVESDQASLPLHSFLIIHVMQFLPVILFDEAGARISTMEPILKAFVNLGGFNELINAIQKFMMRGLENLDVLNEDFYLAVNEIVNFFSKIVNPHVKANDEGAAKCLQKLRELGSLYFLEFIELPLQFRRQIKSETLSKIVNCFANIVLIINESPNDEEAHMLGPFKARVQSIFPKIAEEFIQSSQDTAVELAILIKSLSTPIHGQRPDADAINNTYGWILSSSCPLSNDIRLRLLAASVNSETRRETYPKLVEAIPMFITALEVSIRDNDRLSMASSILLLSEIVFMSTLPIPSGYGEGSSYHYKFHEVKIEDSQLRRLSEIAQELLTAAELDPLLPDLDTDLSILYLIASLTRLRSTHIYFDLGTLLPALIHKATNCLRSKDKRFRSLASLPVIILRHFIETEAYLPLLVEFELNSINPTAFGTRTRPVNFSISSGVDHILCRDFAAFRSAVVKHYALVWENIEWVDPVADCTIAAKKTLNLGEDQKVPELPTLQQLSDIALSPKSQEVIEILIHRLLLETTFPSVESAEENENSEKDETMVMAHFRRCALLVTLVELIHGYPVCREAFLHSKRLGEFFSFLFHRMTSSGELGGSLGSRLFVNEPMWVSQLLDELCSGPYQISLNDRMSSLPDRVKLVVDHLATALGKFQAEYGTSIDSYSKMSKAWCLTMTVYVLLSVKSTTSVSRNLNPIQAAVAARMLEKKYVAILSAMLKCINDSAPMAPMLAAKIIFSLEMLTRLGNRLARIASGATVKCSNDETFDGSMSEDFDAQEFDDDDDEVISDDDSIGDDEDMMEDDEMLMDVDDDDESDQMGSSSDGDDNSEEDEESDGDDIDMDIDISGYSGADDDSEEDDEDDDDEYSDIYTDDEDEDHYHVVVQPPISRSGPVADAIASGFQVIPMENFNNVADYGRSLSNLGPFVDDFGHDQMLHFDETLEDDDDDDEYNSDGTMEEEDDEDEGFSVEEDVFGDEEQLILNNAPITPLRPRAGHHFGRRSGMTGRVFGDLAEIRQTYSSQAREDEVFMHPLISSRLEGPAAVPRSHTFDTFRLHEASSTGGHGKAKELQVWHENQDVFHFPHVIKTLKRWTQESHLFIKNDSMDIATSATGLYIRDLVPEAEAQRNEERKRQKDHPTKVVDASEDSQSMHDSDHLDSMESGLSELESHEASDAAASTPQEQTNREPIIYEDPGPDREFLEALPFDMRREVLEQYFEERRRNIPEGAEVRINQDFLNALPNDLREDYQRLSRQEVERFRRRHSGRFIGEIDINSILETLGADVQRTLVEAYETDMDMIDADTHRHRHRHHPPPRSTVRQSQSSNSEQVSQIISALSDSMRRLRESTASASQQASTQTSNMSPSTNANNTLGSVSIAKKDYANMVDIPSLATILRLYYTPTMTENRTHIRLFQHLCAGQATRADLLNMLIYILEEMPDDGAQLDAVLDMYVSINSVGKSKIASQKPTPRKRSPLPKPSASDPLGGSSYVVIQQRTLQVLMQLVQHDEEVKKFFIAYYESPWTIKRFDRKNEKGAKPSVTSTHYPVVLLLACLGRSTFTQVPLLVEYLLHLLQMVTIPLKDIVESNKNNNNDVEKKEPLPDIPPPFVHSLVRAVVNCELSPKAFQYSTHVFQNLSLIESVANVILGELSDMTLRMAEATTTEVSSLESVLLTKDKNGVNEMLKTISYGTSAQSKLLRGMKMLSSTIIRPAKNDLERTDSFDYLIDTPGIKWDIPIESVKKSLWTGLFHKLERCLTSIREETDMYHVATALLPAIESYFWHIRQALALLFEERIQLESSVLDFAEKNRIILNSMIRTNPTLLTTGAFILLTKIPRSLDFDNKRVWFRQQLVKKGASRPTISVHVRRAHVFEDSFHAIMGRSGDEIKYGKLSIKFHEEDGLDAGGVTREWFSVLSRQMFDPNYALFKVSAVDKITYQPNRMSYINPDHLMYFTFIGRIIGKAIYDSRLLDCYFTRSFYKHILHIPVDFKDLEAVDPEYYKSLSWILENDITDVMELTFSVESDEFGIHKIIDLKPEGSTIPVTESNKKEYVRLVVENKLTTAIKPQIDAFMRGFTEIISVPLISIFNEQELELLISGMPDIDVDDWKNNTEYSGYSVSSPQIQWFWRAARSFDQEYRAKLLQFVTGTSKVPLDGFAALQGSTGVQKFQIHRDYGAKDRLPSAHTCFNQLDLPEYESYETLRDRLIKVINECATGFGLV